MDLVDINATLEICVEAYGVTKNALASWISFFDL